MKRICVTRAICPPEREAAIHAEADIMCALVEARNEEKISQRKLEELTGVKNSTIHRMEKGANRARRYKLKRS
jgi:DNA-binding XRE family transcriptional regulator